MTTSTPETYGFIYIWFDRKHKRYYVGSHWGNEDDGYICSSSWMKRAQRLRPQDFRRRLLQRIYTNRKDLMEVESRWLHLIKEEELGNRYYNLYNRDVGHWADDPLQNAAIGTRISAGKKRAFQKRIAETGEAFSEEHRARIAASNTGKKQSIDRVSKKAAALAKAHAEGRHAGMRGKTMTEEHRRKISDGNTGKVISVEQREKIAKGNSKRHTITYLDGTVESIHGLKAFGVDRSIPYVTLYKASQNGTAIKKYGIQSIVVEL